MLVQSSQTTLYLTFVESTTSLKTQHLIMVVQLSL